MATVTKHLIIPDVQAKPGNDFSYLACLGRYAVKHKPDVIVCLGDFADMPSLSQYDVGKKSFEGRTYQSDIEAAKEAMAYLMVPILREQTRLTLNKKKSWNPKLVLTLGNHENRIDRAIELDRKLDGLISINDLEYSTYGWEVVPFLQPIIIDGVVYCHYLTSGVMGRPITTARGILTQRHQSAVVGHQQGRDVAYSKRADGKRITALICGSCYEHNENYLDAQANNHWRGVVLLNEVCDGEYDEMFVSLKFLREKYSE